MKRIGLLTLHCTDNYGAMLQAYALQSILSRYGQASVIDYRPEAVARLLSDSPVRDPGSPGRILSGLCTALETRRKHAHFRRFMGERLRLTGERYASYEELRAAAKQFDVIVCGSDQIWNPRITRWDPSYFLGFADNTGGRRVAYAASIGLDDPDERETGFVRAGIRNLDRVSVREERARELLAALGVTARRVADPVLLLEKADWERISIQHRKVAGREYLFSYPMTKDPLFYSTQALMASLLGLRVVTPFGSIRNRARFDTMVFDASPEEFLGMLLGSSHVVTNSFHGAALALLMGKNCVVTALEQKNSRLQTLLDVAGVPERMVRDIPTIAHMQSLLDGFRPDRVLRHIAAEREASLSYLEEAINS